MGALTIAALMLLANATAVLTSSFWVLLLIWSTAMVGILRNKLLKLHAVFLVATAAPMYVALLIVWLSASERPQIVESAFGGNLYWYAGFLALRIAAIGAVLQWLLVPVIQQNRLESVLHELGAGRQVILAITSTFVLLDDFRRKGRAVLEARTARGLVGNSWMARWGSILSTISPLIYISIISGIQRADLWHHRNLAIVGFKATGDNRSEYRPVDFALVLWFVTIAVIAALGGL